MFCAISGVTPEEPVVSKRSGLLFEKRLIEKHIAVQAVTIHATHNYFVTASLDKTWCFYDLSSGLCLTQTAAYDGVKLWDLRKLKNFRSFTPYDSNTPTNSVEFDHSGSYLAIAGSDIRVYQVASVKQEWNSIKTFPDLSGTGKATCVRFGPDATYLAVGTGDRNLRIFGSPDAASEP